MLLGQCLENITFAQGLTAGMFFVGLVGGFTHCAGMCSPFILAQINDSPQISKIKSSFLLPYHLGRMTTYVALAVLLNSAINLAFLFSDLKSLIAAPLLVLAGLMFMISAFPRLGNVFPWASKIQIPAPYGLIQKFSNTLTQNPNTLKRYGLGVLLGFMPCGLVISALLASGAAANAGQAALSMAAFALGTMPALILVAIGAQSLKHKYPKIIERFSRGAMVVSSLWLFTLVGLMFF